MIKNTYKFIAVALMALVLPTFAMAFSGTPKISMEGANRVYTTKVVILMTYDSNTASYNTTDEYPVTYIEYTNLDTDQTLITYTNSEAPGKRTHTYAIYKLQPNTEYSYRGVLKYENRIVKTEEQTFKTASTDYPVYGSTNSGTTSGTTTTTTTTNTSVATVPKVVSNLETSVKNSVMTGGGTFKDGVGISITNEQARTSIDDTFTYTVKYQNTKLTSINNAELVIQLPEQYEFVKSSVEMDYNERDNTVSYTIGRVAANTLKTVTFTARAIGDGKTEVRTTATLFYEGGSISATDRDAFNGGAKSVLGASVFGAGFFPQTFVGWVAILLLIAAIIIIARRYMVAAPKPMVIVQHPAQPQHQQQPK